MKCRCSMAATITLEADQAITALTTIRTSLHHVLLHSVSLLHPWEGISPRLKMHRSNQRDLTALMMISLFDSYKGYWVQRINPIKNPLIAEKLLRGFSCGLNGFASRMLEIWVEPISRIVPSDEGSKVSG